MRRLLILAALATLLIPSTVAAAGRTSHSLQDSLAAIAHWTTVPASGEIVGEVYTETIIAASLQVSTFNGEQQFSSGLFLLGRTYQANGTPSGSILESTFGFSFEAGSVGQITIDRGLRSASASGDILVTTCTFAPFVCSDDMSSIEVEWVGQGGITASNTKPFHFSEDGVTVIDHFRGTSRSAAITGSVDGTEVLGRPIYLGTPTQIAHNTSRVVVVCHGPSVC